MGRKGYMDELRKWCCVCSEGKKDDEKLDGRERRNCLALIVAKQVDRGEQVV